MTLRETLEQYPGNPSKLVKLHRNNLPELFKELGFKVGAEIGVYKGQFSEMFCQAGLKMYSIDPWMSYRGAGRAGRGTEEQNAAYEEAKERLSQYGDFSVIIRKTSNEALFDIRNGSLDFVYID